jgi:hypothetical protein
MEVDMAAVAPAATAPRLRLKAQSFRSYIGLLEKDGKRDAVLALLPPDTAAIFTHPPLASTWMDYRHSVVVAQAVEKLGGMAAVREMARKGTDEARKPYMGVVETVLKLFGASPAILLKRMNSLVSSFIEGVEYRYTATSERSGVMDIEWDADWEIPTCALVSQVPSLQVLVDICGVRGTIGPPERVGPRHARYVVRW